MGWQVLVGPSRGPETGAEMDAKTYPRLLGDIGGTNARFAWKADATASLSHVSSYPCAQFATLEQAMRSYLAERGAAAAWCAIGIANPVVDDHVQMTNHHWSFSISEVKRALGFERFLVLNDFTSAGAVPAVAGACGSSAGRGQCSCGRGAIGAHRAWDGAGCFGSAASAERSRCHPSQRRGGACDLGVNGMHWKRLSSACCSAVLGTPRLNGPCPGRAWSTSMGCCARSRAFR